jgi:hypothetical protein
MAQQPAQEELPADAAKFRRRADGQLRGRTGRGFWQRPVAESVLQPVGFVEPGSLASSGPA